jgi:hypothetical protein
MFEAPLIAHDQPPTVIHPPEAALHFPAVTVVRTCTDRVPALGMAPWPACKRGDSRLDAPPTQIPAEGLTIVGSISDQFLGPRAWTPSSTRHVDHGQGGFRQRALVRLCTCDMQPDRQTLAISYDHDFRTLADLRPPDAGPPAFAGTKLPSRKACAHSSLLCASSWLNSCRQTPSQVPSAVQTCKRRQQVVGDPYARGTSSQVKSVFSTHRIPFRVCRSSARLRPCPGDGFGISGWMTAHCSSVSSWRLIPSV